MSHNKAYFHFTLGPVQSFVVQARRTRDFWAGSFILSWLSGVAVREVMAQCDNDPECILFPKAEATFLGWIDGTGKKGESPSQGSIPNRFKAQVNPEAFEPKKVVKAVNIAWKALADTVYQHDFGRLKVEPDKSDWDNQIENCWEMVWALTDDVTDSSILDRRKGWRTYSAPEQLGVKCMMMDGWQELSGVESPNQEELENFWKPLRESSSTIKSDLRDGEYLCAIAFVKRRFPRHFGRLQPYSMPSGWTLNGWKVDAGRPSVSYMAAVHWLENVIKQANHSDEIEALMQEFHQAAYKLTEEYGEWSSNIRCIREALDAKQRNKKDKRWKALNGDVFFSSVLENTSLYPAENKQRQAQETLRKLKRLQRETQLGDAPPFYAVLMMDGDSLGKQMSDESKQHAISSGLQTFTRKVAGSEGEQGIVDKHNGFLVYAGGDDVLAVLPTDDALACALEIRETYQAIFAEYESIDLNTSISAAIEFAHIRMPLTKILRNSHYLLDDIAKERCGRDSIAVRVWKPGGKALQWAMPWQEACDNYVGKKRLVLDRLAENLKGYQSEHDQDGQLSHSFFYKIRDRLELLNPPRNAPDSQSPLTREQAIDVMAAEYVNSGLCMTFDTNEAKLKHARIMVEPLLQQCNPKRWVKEGDQPRELEKSKTFHVDAALLVRFLMQKEVL